MSLRYLFYGLAAIVILFVILRFKDMPSSSSYVMTGPDTSNRAAFVADLSELSQKAHIAYKFPQAFAFATEEGGGQYCTISDSDFEKFVSIFSLNKIKDADDGYLAMIVGTNSPYSGVNGHDYAVLYQGFKDGNENITAWKVSGSPAQLKLKSRQLEHLIVLRNSDTGRVFLQTGYKPLEAVLAAQHKMDNDAKAPKH